MSKSFTAACREFFDFLPGQKLGDFAAELKALTPKDKQDIYEGFKAVGFDCDPPQPTATVGLTNPAPTPAAVEPMEDE